MAEKKKKKENKAAQLAALLQAEQDAAAAKSAESTVGADKMTLAEMLEAAKSNGGAPVMTLATEDRAEGTPGAAEGVKRVSAADRLALKQATFSNPFLKGGTMVDENTGEVTVFPGSKIGDTKRPDVGSVIDDGGNFIAVQKEDEQGRRVGDPAMTSMVGPGSVEAFASGNPELDAIARRKAEASIGSPAGSVGQSPADIRAQFAPGDPRAAAFQDNVVTEFPSFGRARSDAMAGRGGLDREEADAALSSWNKSNPELAVSSMDELLAFGQQREEERQRALSLDERNLEGLTASRKASTEASQARTKAAENAPSYEDQYRAQLKVKGDVEREQAQQRAQDWEARIAEKTARIIADAPALLGDSIDEDDFNGNVGAYIDTAQPEYAGDDPAEAEAVRRVRRGVEAAIRKEYEFDDGGWLGAATMRRRGTAPTPAAKPASAKRPPAFAYPTMGGGAYTPRPSATPSKAVAKPTPAPTPAAKPSSSVMDRGAAQIQAQIEAWHFDIDNWPEEMRIPAQQLILDFENNLLTAQQVEQALAKGRAKAYALLGR